MAKATPRILFNAKDHHTCASGYGIIAKHLVPRLADRYGKDNVLLFAPVYNRDHIEDWNGVKVLPGLSGAFEDDLLLQHYKQYQCNMLLQVGDWVMLKQIPTWAARDEILWVQWCLAGESVIISSEGPVPIKDCTVGSLILGWDGRRVVWTRVAARQEIPYSGDLYRIEVGNEIVQATPDHLIYGEHGWVRADQLTVGMRVLCATDVLEQRRNSADADSRCAGLPDSGDRPTVGEDSHRSHCETDETTAEWPNTLCEASGHQKGTLVSGRGLASARTVSTLPAAYDHGGPPGPDLVRNPCSRRSAEDPTGSDHSPIRCRPDQAGATTTRLSSRPGGWRGDHNPQPASLEHRPTSHNAPFVHLQQQSPIDGMALDSPAHADRTPQPNEAWTSTELPSRTPGVWDSEPVGIAAPPFNHQEGERRHHRWFHSFSDGTEIQGTLQPERDGALPASQGPESTFQEVTSIARIPGPPFVYDVTTDTGNFFANGLLVHNCPFDFVNPPPWVKDVIRLALKAVPFTQYAERQFRAMGLTNVEPAIWLGIEPKIWFPQDRRRLPQVMAALGFAEDTYNILIVQANQIRKNVREQLEAIKLFREAVPEAKPRLYLHSHTGTGDRALDLDLKELGLEDITLTVDQYTLACGGLPEEQMSGIFNCADVVMDCCFEGFGYSTLQAQAVGVPAIIMEEGPGPELTRFGVQVPAHHLDRNTAVQKPVADPQHIAQALIELYQQRGVRSELSPRWVAEHFNWDTIAEQWFRVIEDTMVMRETYSLYLPQPSARLRRRGQELVEL